MRATHRNFEKMSKMTFVLILLKLLLLCTCSIYTCASPDGPNKPSLTKPIRKPLPTVMNSEQAEVS